MTSVGPVTAVCRVMVLLLVSKYVVSQRGVECPRVQRPWNGETVGTCQRFVGAQCSFTCRSPYVVRGSQTRMCQADGTWSGQLAYCELEHCPNCNNNNHNNIRCLPVVAHPGSVIDSSCTGEVGTSCIFRCTNNLPMVGQPVLVCLPSGVWSGQPPFCRGVVGQQNDGRCPTLNAPEGGRLIGSCTISQVADICQLVCISGYRPSDTRILVCQENGAWSDSLPTCIGGVTAQCPNIFINQGGTTSGNCSPGVPGQTCTITCYSGYTISGPGTLTCQSSGSWSRNIPTCNVISCPALPAPASGSVSGSCNPGVIGENCNFACNSGYQLTGEPSLLCGNNGEWSANPPTCVVRTCPTLPAPASGSNSGSCSPGAIGQRCNFACNTNFQLVGESSLLCGNDGEWSANPPTCVAASCPTLYPPPNGVTSNSCNGATTGQTCIFTCQPGYTLVGQPALVCQNGGRWSGQPPSCVAAPSCPTLFTPANGAQSGSCGPATPGQTCTFSCQPGYALTGQSTLYCQDGGRWSGNPPTCTASTCPTLNPPANGGQFGSCVQATSGQTCTFSCQAGFTLVGSATLVCQSGGTWSSSAPYCNRATASCPNLYAPDYGYISGTCAPGQSGQTCTFRCQNGYSLQGSGTLTCQSSGTWSSLPPTCEGDAVSCPNLYPPENGYIIGTCGPGQAGRTCTFGCQNGYDLQGSGILTCQSSGTWSSLPPTCEGRETESNCPALLQPANGEFIECDNRPGGRCVVVCQRGYLRNGSRVRTCLPSRVWSGFAPTCGRKAVYGYKVVPLWSLLFG